MKQEDIEALRSGPGMVLLIDWMLEPSKGRQVKVVSGYIEIVSTEDLGLKVGSASEKWAAVVIGTDTTVTIPGCKISALVHGAPPATNPLDVWYIE